VTAQARR